MHTTTHTLKIILSTKKNVQKSFGFSSEILWTFYCHLRGVGGASIFHSLLSLHLLWLPSIHDSPAIYPGQEEHSQLCCSSSISVCYPSPLEQAGTPVAILSCHIHFVLSLLSYRASTLNCSAAVQPGFGAGSACLGKLLSLIY